MENPDVSRAEIQFALNPLFALWAMPFIMTQEWMKVWLGAVARPYKIAHDKPSLDSATGQIPVPHVFQENKERELFA